MSGSAPRSSRGNPKVGDIVRTVAMMAVIVLGIWAFGLLFTNTPDDAVPHVDLDRSVADARRAASYPLLAPAEADLPEGWRANGIRFDVTGDQPWHVGMVTADDDYIGLEQQLRSIDAMVRDFASGSAASGTVTVGGVPWQRRAGPGSTLVYLRTAGDSTIVVVSDAPRADTERYLLLLGGP